jgi:hypothetical protein
LFAALAARETEPRLRIGGWRERELLGGRVLGLLGVALGLALAYWLLVLADRRPERAGALALMLAVTACTAVAVGTALGAVVRREQDGALLLFLVAGLQFIANPPTLLAHALPFWSTRELGTWAIDGPRAGSLGAALAHAAATIAVCALLASSARKNSQLVSVR